MTDKAFHKALLFSLALVLVVVGVAAAMVWFARPYLLKLYRPLVIQQLAATLSPEEKASLYDELRKETPAMWDSVPEPLVGRIAKANIDVMQSYAEVRTNNAGMRSIRPYLPKSTGVYRIVCLGDSFVFGEAGKEEDRWCNQMQDWFNQSGTMIGGKKVETLAVGVSSWTMLQEATYMTSRLTDYDPDLIIVLTVQNDITDDTGVTAAGLLTSAFSQNDRSWGSGTLNNMAGAEFGQTKYSAMMYDQTPVAQHYWTEGMDALKHLAELQQRRKGRIFLSVMNEEGNRAMYFESLFKAQAIKAGIEAPVFDVTYLKSEQTMLPHDSHPNREGHALLAAQYLHAMEQAGIFTAEKPLPELDDKLKPEFFDTSEGKRKRLGRLLEQGRKSYLKYYREEIAFDQLSIDDTQMFLGGILPDREQVLSRPWGSVRSGFVLKPSPGKKTLVLEIDIPDRTELFPMQVTVRIHNAIEKSFVFASAGQQKLEVPVDDALLQLPALEILVYANHYFAQIDDHRMKSFRYLSAHWE